MENRKNATVEPLFYTAKDFCKAAKISQVTFYRWCKLPDFPAIRTGRKILVPCAEVREWINQHAGRRVM